MHDALVTGAIDGDGCIRSGASRREVVLGPTQVAGAFFARRPDKLYRTVGWKRRVLERFYDREHRGDAAAVVGDARAVVASAGLSDAVLGSPREHSVEVRAYGDRLLFSATSPPADDVSRSIDLHAGQSE